MCQITRDQHPGDFSVRTDAAKKKWAYPETRRQVGRHLLTLQNDDAVGR